MIKTHPDFSKMDTALWYLAQARAAEDESSDDAEAYDRAVEKLKHPDPQRRELSLRVSALVSDVGTYARSISQRGVLVNENDEVEHLTD